MIDFIVILSSLLKKIRILYVSFDSDEFALKNTEIVTSALLFCKWTLNL